MIHHHDQPDGYSWVREWIDRHVVRFAKRYPLTTFVYLMYTAVVLSFLLIKELV